MNERDRQAFCRGRAWWTPTFLFVGPRQLAEPANRSQRRNRRQVLSCRRRNPGPWSLRSPDQRRESPRCRRNGRRTGFVPVPGDQATGQVDGPAQTQPLRDFSKPPATCRQRAAQVGLIPAAYLGALCAGTLNLTRSPWRDGSRESDKGGSADGSLPHRP
jgi:hypothetical protein